MDFSCACKKISHSVTVDEKHICNCSTCLKYTSKGKSCIFFTTPVRKLKLRNIISYKSGEESERLFCKKCFTFIGMKYKQHSSFYVNQALFENEAPKGLTTRRFIWPKKNFSTKKNSTTVLNVK